MDKTFQAAWLVLPPPPPFLGSSVPRIPRLSWQVGDWAQRPLSEARGEIQEGTLWTFPHPCWVLTHPPLGEVKFSRLGHTTLPWMPGYRCRPWRGFRGGRRSQTMRAAQMVVPGAQERVADGDLSLLTSQHDLTQVLRGCPCQILNACGYVNLFLFLRLPIFAD